MASWQGETAWYVSNCLESSMSTGTAYTCCWCKLIVNYYLLLIINWQCQNIYLHLERKKKLWGKTPLIVIVLVHFQKSRLQSPKDMYEQKWQSSASLLKLAEAPALAKFKNLPCSFFTEALALWDDDLRREEDEGWQEDNCCWSSWLFRRIILGLLASGPWSSPVVVSLATSELGPCENDHFYIRVGRR